MRWRCTVESAEKNEFSVLALVESVLAVSASLYIAWYFQTLWHIIAASCLAPFLLLRTDESTRKGLNAFRKVSDYIDSARGNHQFLLVSIGIILVAFLLSFFLNTHIVLAWLILCLCSLILWWLDEKGKLEIKSLPFPLKVAVLVVVAGGVGGIVVVAGVGAGTVGTGLIVGGSLFCKVWATMATCITSPWQSLKAIPHNWKRIVFCVDMCHPPELMPGMEGGKYEELSDGFKHFQLGRWISKIGDLIKKEWTDKFTASILILFTPFLYLPALAYRWLQF